MSVKPMINVDSLNLPDVGDQYFWRIVQGGLNIDHLELRKTIIGNLSYKADSRPLQFYTSEGQVVVPDEVIQVAAELIAREHTLWAGYYGDYKKTD